MHLAVSGQGSTESDAKTLRRFSSWEVCELILGINQSTFRGQLAADRSFPPGKVEPNGRQRWFSLAEVNTLRRRLTVRGRTLQPDRPAGRAFRTAFANFDAGTGKTTTALHFAHAAALDGYRVLLIDCDPQAVLSRSLGVTHVSREQTIWGILARDLVTQTAQMNAAQAGHASHAAPASLRKLGLEDLRNTDFIRKTPWSTIDLIPSCVEAAFVSFASTHYRQLDRDWSHYAALSRFLDHLPNDAWDLVFLDCPPGIGFHSINALYASDMLCVPTAATWDDFDSTTAFIGQIAAVLEELGQDTRAAGTSTRAKAFCDMRVLLTRFDSDNPEHRATRDAFGAVFADRLSQNPIQSTRALEQPGRLLRSIYEIDYREMTRDSWRSSRANFDRAWSDCHDAILPAWRTIAAMDA
nr:AAA family ATPase [Yoonia vestfoldensis]